MSFLGILVIAFALATDAFCTALGIGTGTRFSGQTFRLSFHFGLFQAAMPAIGWAAGTPFVEFVHSWDHWLAGGIVSLLALHLFWEAIHAKGGTCGRDLSRGWSLVSLSIATSIDALAMGLVFAVLEISIWLPCLIIGLVAAGGTFIGLRLGRRLKARYGLWLQIAGALVLLLVAVKLFQI